MANYTGYPRAQGGARLQHPADGARPAVAPAGPLSRGASGDARCSTRSSRAICRAAASLSGVLLVDPGRAGGWRPSCSRGAQPHQYGGQDLRLHRAGGELRPAARLHRHRLLRAHHVLRHRRLRRGPRALRLGRDLDLGRWSASPSRWSLGVALAFADRPVLAAGAGHLLRHDHAGGGLGLRDPGLAALGLTGGEDGRTFRVPEMLRPGFTLVDAAAARRAINGRAHRLLHRVPVGAGAVPGAAAHRQLAVRPRAAGDPRERLPRRGAGLPHRLLPHRPPTASPPRMAVLAGALNALWLRYTGPDTTLVLRHHARHPADGGDRRHGHACTAR